MSESETPFSRGYTVLWGDVDALGHMRNTAYLEYAANTRMLYFASQGSGIIEMVKQGVAPVVLHDTISYRRELRPLAHFRVDMTLAGINEVRSRFKIVNTVYSDDDVLCAEVTSVIVMMDMHARTRVEAPAPFVSAMENLVRTADFDFLT